MACFWPSLCMPCVNSQELLSPNKSSFRVSLIKLPTMSPIFQHDEVKSSWTAGNFQFLFLLVEGLRQKFFTQQAPFAIEIFVTKFLSEKCCKRFKKFGAMAPLKLQNCEKSLQVTRCNYIGCPQQACLGQRFQNMAHGIDGAPKMQLTCCLLDSRKVQRLIHLLVTYVNI